MKMMLPVMQFGEVEIFQLKDIITRKKEKMTRLTKWLPPVRSELSYLEKEYLRITKDPSRKCYIIYDQGLVALFVNDVTNGMFDRLGEEET